MRLSKEFDWLMRRSNVPENVGFPYSPLDQSKDEIRLLHLQPRQPGQALSCRLFTTSISEVDNAFYALSYTWGRPPAPCQLRINGRRFNVRNSLWSFLRSFSKHIKEPTDIWIDAICVDQNATAERNHQVAMMHDIYSRASKVCVWLGTLQAKDQAAHKFITAVVGDSDSDHTDCFTNQGDSCPDTGDFAIAHNRLTEREYFKRLWVIQEMLLAKEVDVCIGKYVMAWTSWTNFWQRHLSHHHPHFQASPVWNSLKTRRERRSDPSATVDIGALVTEFGKQRCLDPHDRVYALLGLANPPVCFNVDYDHLLSHIFREVHNENKRASFVPTSRLAETICNYQLASLPVICSCAECAQSALRVFALAFGVVRDIRHSDKGSSLLSPLIEGKPFECIDAQVGRRSMKLASLTNASRIELSDTIYNLDFYDLEDDSMGIALAVSKDDVAHPKPCIYFDFKRPLTTDKLIINQVRALYCILTGLLSDRSLTWKVDETTSMDNKRRHLPPLFFEGPFKTMFEWISAFNNTADYLDKQTTRLKDLCGKMSTDGYRSITEKVRPACMGLGMRFERDAE